MTAQRATRSIAGFFVLLSVSLAATFNGVDILHPTWLWFTIFVGLNLFQSGLSGWCLMTNILRRVGLQ